MKKGKENTKQAKSETSKVESAKAMQLVEQHVIDHNDPRYQIIDDAAFKSKNLYNATLYEVRQSFIYQNIYLDYNEMDKRMKQHEAYKALPAKVAQKVLEQVHEAWINYFKACKEYKEHPEKFLGHPRLPKYKHKTEGRNLLVYTEQAVSKRGLNKGLIKPSQLPIQVRTQQRAVNQVRIIPKKGFYVLEVVYEKKIIQAQVDHTLYAGIDIGVNNLAAIASNKKGFVPRVVNGRPLKSYNQWYNKRKAQLQKKLGTTGSTKQMERLTNKRNRRIDHAMHTASRQIIDLLVEEGIGTVIIGKNPGWKQACQMSKKNKQNFVQLPQARFIEQLTYKAELVGIKVIITEESYTSKASFLDLDEIPTYDPKEPDKKYKFSGARVKRGLYRASGKRYINADAQGAYNVIRKSKPNVFTAEGIADGVVVHPVRIARTKPKKQVVNRSQVSEELYYNNKGKKLLAVLEEIST